ncbi:Bifunctional dethiobiotin synthetase/7,8-diamino-pelargonic acid aminotransferase, mitochondrial [Zea mays]|uniref:Bifunctional dethiobiotin synthetase/7,8-diamino-pelargonic acid aminotransferase, mitochondrial n=1 Tax=Zea mays TaxID=4577 RepID=A0A3L6G030_MAIZE|nr:Bifunctional dethiobiotin synthetase/7,8-diamino-pelargonic acid aminotransferase, mitochondrial [Zea mays]
MARYMKTGGFPILLNILKEDREDVEFVRGALETFMSALTHIETSQGESCNKDVPIVHVDMHNYSLDEKIRMTLEAHIVEKTDEVHEVSFVDFSSQAESFCKTMDRTFAIDLYSSYIKQKLSEFSLSNSSKCLVALIIEPGGILMMDPLFQRVLSTSELLGCLPVIACYAKLMTEFMALLHDHSYTVYGSYSNLDAGHMKLKEEETNQQCSGCRATPHLWTTSVCVSNLFSTKKLFKQKDRITEKDGTVMRLSGGGHNCFQDSDEARLTFKRKFWKKVVEIDDLCGNDGAWWGIKGYMRDNFNHSNKVTSQKEHF